jgi:hypothetical protein
MLVLFKYTVASLTGKNRGKRNIPGNIANSLFATGALYFTTAQLVCQIVPRSVDMSTRYFVVYSSFTRLTQLLLLVRFGS